jgi:hypothetical protein
MHVILVLAVLGLALPGLGPVFDHHFAERLHDHQHIFLDSATVGHQHPYQHIFLDSATVGHQHPYQNIHGHAIRTEEANGAPAGIGLFPNWDASSHGATPFVSLAPQPQLDFQDRGTNPALFGVAQSRSIPPGQPVPPPQPPPRH